MAREDTLKARRIHDYDWLRQSFMISHGTQKDSRGDPLDADVITRTRYFTTAMFKFTDTTLGGNLVINPLPQFTRTADIRVRGMYAPSAGQGRMYSEWFDDNKRYVTMTCGVPQHNSLTTFYKGFYSHDLALAARTGRSNDFFYTAGRVAGFLVGLMAPWLVLYSVASAFVKWALNKPSTKYYFLKQTMPTYWNTVSSIANDLAVKTGFISRVIAPPPGTATDNRETLSPSEVSEINRYLAEEGLVDSFNESTGEANGINVYAVATRAQRIQRKAMKTLANFYNRQDAQGLAEWSRSSNRDIVGSDPILSEIRKEISKGDVRRPSVPFFQYLKSWTDGGPGVLPGSQGGGMQPEQSMFGEGQTEFTEANVNSSADFVAERAFTDYATIEEAEKTAPRWYEFLAAELDDGAQYVSFRVENTGDAGESISNQVGEPEIAAKINQISGAARSTRFSLADGNVGDGVFGQIANTVLDGAKSFAMGAAQSLGFSGLAVLGGNAFVDIPKTWTGSVFNANRMSYTIKLISPYGNRYSKFVNIWLPLSMLLALAFPLSTGHHTYTSPFLVQLFDRGRAQTRLGIVDSMQIKRGGGNLAWNKMGEPMMVEVNFSVTELSSIMHLPIKQGFNPVSGLSEIFDSESLYHDYMSTLSSLSLAEQIYTLERFKIGLTRYIKNVDSYFSVPHAMNWIGDFGVSRIASAIFPGVTNR